MGLMDKIKNMFTEEEEIDEEEPIKKEVIQVEIPSAMNKREEKKEVIEPPKEERVIQETVKKTKQEEKFIFPVYFDDDDFTDIDKKTKEERKIREEKRLLEEKRKIEEKRKYEEPRVIPKPIRETYKGKPVVEEKKVFKPTPIVSPVYGILDKNYTKEDITSKRQESSKKISDIDIIRNKAYGTLEDEIVDSLNYKEEKKVHTTDMDEYHKQMDDVFRDLLEQDDLDNNLDELENKLSKPKETKVNEVQPKYSRTSRTKKVEQDVLEDDLFDMIDTMYKEEK